MTRSSLDAQRRMLKRRYFEALSMVRANERALRRHAAQGHLLILNVHSVSPHTNPYGPSLHPEAFADLLAWLQRRATMTLLRDLPGPADRDSHRPLVVLSFDDGLKDFIEHAMPVLASLGLRANQNVIGESVETGDPPWAIHLVDLLGAARTEIVRQLRVPGFPHRLPSDDPSAKERFGAALTNHFKGLSPADRAPAWSALQETMQDVVVERPTRMMSSSDVAAARAAGHEIGSHSYSHESMEYLDDAAFLADLRRSRNVLAGAGCEDCAVYSFPNGSHRPGQVKLALQAGVRHVLLSGERPSLPESAVHTRVTLRGSSVAELRARSVHGLGLAGRYAAKAWRLPQGSSAG